MRLREGPLEGAEDLPFRGEDGSDSSGRKKRSCWNGRGVKGARLDAGDAEPRETVAHLAGRLIGERDGQQRAGGEGTGRDLVGEAAGDRGRLARTGPRQDADGPGDRLDRLASDAG